MPPKVKRRVAAQKHELIRQIRKGPLVYTPKPLEKMSLGELQRVHRTHFGAVKPGSQLHRDDAFAQAVKGKVVAPALKVLEQTTRPLHGVVEATQAVGRGQEPFKPFAHGFLHGHKTFPDLGLPGPLGLVADIVADPLTYVTFGTGSVARKGVLSAAEHAGEQAANKGIRVGVRAKVPFGPAFEAKTSGRGTAALSRTLGLSRSATAVRGRPTVQALGRSLAPDFRPKDVTPREWEAYRAATTRKRAASGAGVRYAERRGQAFRRALKDEESPQVIAAMERATKSRQAVRTPGADARRVEQLRAMLRPGSGATAGEQENAARFLRRELGKPDLVDEISTHHTVEGLPPHLQAVARQAQEEFGAAGTAERAAGILGSTRQNYVPHQFVEDIEGVPLLQRIVRRREAKSPYSQKRKLEGAIADINAQRVAEGRRPIFSEDLPGLTTARLAKSKKALADAAFLHDLGTTVGKPLTRDALDSLPDTHSVYRITATGIKPLEDSRGRVDFKAAGEALAGRGEPGRYVTLPRLIGEAETKARLAREMTPGRHLLKGWDRFMGGMKTSLTVLNVPAYDLRNLYGDLHNAWLGDADSVSMGQAFRLVARLTGKERRQAHELHPEIDSKLRTLRIKGRKVQADDLLKWAEQDGVVRSGFAGGELHELARGKEGLRIAKHRIRPVQGLRGVGQFREDAVRLGSYLSALRRGMGRSDAAAWVAKHHFDYGDLSEVERGFLRRVFPFYTFAARNTRLQVGKLLQRPGKYATIEKVREEAMKAAGLQAGWEAALPSYQQQGAPVPLKVGGKLLQLYPALPLTDLNRLPLSGWHQAADQLAQNVNPIVKAMGELGWNYSTFFRKPIYRTSDAPDAPRWVPAPGFVGMLPGPVQRKLGIVPDFINKKTGKKGWGWPAQLDYVVRMSPQFGLVAQLNVPGPGSRGQTPATKLLSQATGVRVVQRDPAAEQTNAVYDAMHRLDTQMRDLRDRGKDRRTDGSTYPRYQRLLDHRRELQAQLDKTQGKTGKKPKSKKAPAWGAPTSSAGGWGPSTSTTPSAGWGP